jgi:hypothetical protein
MSNLILIIGHTGQGKSTVAKKIAKAGGKKPFVFDVNNEYEAFPRHTAGDFVEFLDSIENITDTNVIFEEATGYLSGRIGDRVKRLVINKRHKRNNYIFLFHSIADVPPFLYRLSNYIYLLKTADIYDVVKQKEPKLLGAWQKLQSAPKYSKVIIKTI